MAFEIETRLIITRLIITRLRLSVTTRVYTKGKVGTAVFHCNPFHVEVFAIVSRTHSHQYLATLKALVTLLYYVALQKRNDIAGEH